MLEYVGPTPVPVNARVFVCIVVVFPDVAAAVMSTESVDETWSVGLNVKLVLVTAFVARLEKLIFPPENGAVVAAIEPLSSFVLFMTLSGELDVVPIRTSPNGSGFDGGDGLVAGVVVKFWAWADCPSTAAAANTEAAVSQDLRIIASIGRRW